MWHFILHGHFLKQEVLGYDRYNFDVLSECLKCNREEFTDETQ